MADIVGRLNQRYPKLPRLVANTITSKVIQMIKNGALDPFFTDPRVKRTIQSWPSSWKTTAEWVLHLMSGSLRTMPERSDTVRNILQEAVIESLTQASIEIHDLSETEKEMLVQESLSLVRDQLAEEVRRDAGFKEALAIISGGAKGFTIEAGNRMSGYRKTLRDKRLGGK